MSSQYFKRRERYDADGNRIYSNHIADIPPGPRQLWDRVEGESTRAYDSFCAYRDLGPLRSIAKGCEKYYGHKCSIGKQRNWSIWSSKFNWVNRATSYDEYLDQESQRQAIEDMKEMRKRHMNVARAGLAKAIIALQHLDPKTLNAQDVKALIVEMAKLERLSMGEATERHDVKQEVSGTIKNEHTLEIIETIKPIRSAEPTPVAATVIASRPGSSPGPGLPMVEERVVPSPVVPPPGNSA